MHANAPTHTTVWIMGRSRTGLRSAYTAYPLHAEGKLYWQSVYSAPAQSMIQGAIAANSIVHYRVSEAAYRLPEDNGAMRWFGVSVTPAVILIRQLS